jgi:hypothetical protein
MSHIEVFYQVEGVRPVQRIEATSEETLAVIKIRIAAAHGLGADTRVFAEDAEDALDEASTLGSIATGHGARVHVHRCHRIAVTVSFAGRAVERAFGPGTTVAHVKRWAVDKLGMSKEDATEHVLQIAGTHDRPTPSTHIGTLVHCPHCQIAFDLVADERVQG